MLCFQSIKHIFGCVQDNMFITELSDMALMHAQYWPLPSGSSLHHKHIGLYTEGLLLSTCTTLCRPSYRNNGWARSSFAGLVATLSTQVSIGHPSPIPIHLDLEALAVLHVLDSIHGHLETKLGGYAASELQRLGESYPNCETAYKTVVVLPHQWTSSVIEQYHKCFDVSCTLFR